MKRAHWLEAVAALFVILLVAGASPAAAHWGVAASGLWAGTWQTDMSTKSFLVLTQAGNNVGGVLRDDAGGKSTKLVEFAGVAATDGDEGARNVVRGDWEGLAGGHFAGQSGKFTFVLDDAGLNHLRIDIPFWGNIWASKVSGAPTGKPAATTKRDTSPPVVRAYPPAGHATPGATVALRYTVKDDSGRATVAGTLFQDGEPVLALRPVKVAAGSSLWNAPLTAGLTGPLYYCLWAKDAAGNSSRGAPQSSCAWIPLLVDIAKVSNGCGGSGWKWFVAGQNYVGNSQVFEEPGGASYHVSFVPACNLHDAGYGGQMVRDSLNGNVPIDYRTWSRKQVDDKFKSDMAMLCQRIPAKAKTARIRCEFNWRYNFVRKAGWAFFDADLRKPGVQSEGSRASG